MGIFTELSILYSKYAPPKREHIFHSIDGLLKSVAVMEHLKLFVARINIPKVRIVLYRVMTLQLIRLQWAGYQGRGKGTSLAGACLLVFQV
jgi:hypothetical protein